MSIPSPNVVAHADWSRDPTKRWFCAAVLRPGLGYVCEAPQPVGRLPEYFDALAARAGGAGGTVLAGFDFPIGLPASFGRVAGLDRFLPALRRFGEVPWADIYHIAESAAEVSVRRPFYPARPGGTSRDHLLRGLGLADADALLRDCERATAYRNAACPLFWTLGGNQVGRAAITGWRDLLAPALGRFDGRLGVWPFDGLIGPLLASCRLVVVETYPADVYRRLGFPRGGWSKRRQPDRHARAAALIAWFAGAGPNAAASPALQADVMDGFGPAKSGEDRFDAVVGLLGMLDVVLGRRPEGVPDTPAVRRLEGWIFGQ